MTSVRVSFAVGYSSKVGKKKKRRQGATLLYKSMIKQNTKSHAHAHLQIVMKHSAQFLVDFLKILEEVAGTKS